MGGPAPRPTCAQLGRRFLGWERDAAGCLLRPEHSRCGRLVGIRDGPVSRSALTSMKSERYLRGFFAELSTPRK